MTTNATNETQYFHFPLFVSGDKPSWLTDWNGTVEELDNILEQHRLAIQANAQGMESFNDQVAVIKDDITDINNSISAQDTKIADLIAKYTALNTAIIQADTSIKALIPRMSTAELKIETLEGNVTDLGYHIDGIHSSINRIDTSLANVIKEIDGSPSEGIEGIIPQLNKYKTEFDALLEGVVGTVNEWNSETTYNKADVVYVLSNDGTEKTYYLSKTGNDNINKTPTDIVNNYWLKLSLMEALSTNFYSLYTSLKNSHPVARAWSNNHAYSVDDLIYVDEDTSTGGFAAPLMRSVQYLPMGSVAFRCIKNHTSSQANKPDAQEGDNEWWQSVMIGDIITDLMKTKADRTWVNERVSNLATKQSVTELTTSVDTLTEDVSSLHNDVYGYGSGDEGIIGQLNDISNLTGDSTIVTKVNDTADDLMELKNMQGQSTIESAARQAMNMSMDRYRFLLSMESNNWDSTYKLCDTLSGSYWNTATEDISNFLKGNTTQSVSKIISITLALFINRSGHTGNIIGYKPNFPMHNYTNNAQNRFSLACYDVALNSPSANYDRLYSLPIKSFSAMDGMVSGSDRIFVTYDVEAPALLYNDIEQFARIFLTFNSFDSIGVCYADGSIQVVDVNLTNIDKIALKKVGI